jgi:hypothetical protein
VTKDKTTSLPVPDDINEEDIFWIDYGDDEEFMRKVSGNFLELISLEEIPKMMSDGYKYMQNKHAANEIPLTPKFSSTLFDSSNVIRSIARVPNALRSIYLPKVGFKNTLSRTFL